MQKKSSFSPVAVYRRSPLFMAVLSAIILTLTQGARAGGLVNPSFEYGIAANNETDVNDASINPSGGWFTTESDHQIEVWGNGFSGVPAYNGTDFVELNANAVGTLYQDITGVGAGQLLDFQFAHRGRLGVDTMELDITDMTTGLLLFSHQYSDGNTAWGFYNGTITVPNGVATTDDLRFAYVSISSAGGNPTAGNFLDDAGFNLDANSPPAVPEPSTWLGGALAGLGILGFARSARRASRA